MIFKRLIAAVLSLAMLCSCFVFATETAIETAAPVQTLTQEEINKNATGFIDIKPDASYAESVKKLVDFGIINGYEDGTFKPEGEVTRAEMCKMVNLTLGYTDFADAAGFPDVAPTNWYYTYALAAQKVGYVEGYEDKTFRGSNNITRQEFCAILNRLLKPMDLPIPVTISDEVSGWARPHVEAIVKNYIMPLEANNTFRAKENLKRHELASVLAKMAIGPVQKIEADVRFFVNGEQYGETQTVEVGRSAVEPAAPAVPAEDYVFDGWRVIGTQDVVEVGSAIVVADVDYEAVFSQLTHTVTMYVRGAVNETLVVPHGKTATPKVPEVKGFEFLGWSLTEGGEVVKLSDTKITADTVLYAVLEKEESAGGGGGGGGAPEELPFKVKFYVLGDLYDTQNVLKGKYAKEPDEPEVDGYVFGGWSLSENGAVVDISKEKITKATNFYALLEEEEVEPVVYTVTFYVDGKKYDSQFVTEGETAENVANPEKDGYIFKYWSRSDGGSEVKVEYVTIRENTSFYAVFEKEEEKINYFTVTFISEGKTHSTSKIQEGNKASAPAAPSKEGYTFKGWSRTEDGSVTSVSVTVTEDITFYAVFEKIEYTVTFKVDGATKDTQKVGVNESASAPENPAKEGYVFKGWSLSDGGETVNVGSVVITSNTVFYAVFEEKVPEKKTFTVTFMVDGRTYDSQEVVEGESITVPSDPEKADYNFLGWSKSEGGNVTSVVSKPTSNAIYYAVFEQIKKYTVTFYVNSKVYKQVTVVDGEVASAPSNPSVDGYTFKGWSETDGGEIVNVGSVSIKANKSFYAVLEEVEPEKVFFTVTFKVDKNNYDSQQVEQGKNPTAPADPEKDGYKFKGWSRINGGNVVDVTTVVVKGNVVFYAVFEKIETDDDEDDGGESGGGAPGGGETEDPKPEVYTVIFYANGKKHDTQEVEKGDYPDLPDEPEKEGFNFVGWSKTEGGAKVYPEDIAIKADTKYYALFEEIEEEIKYCKVVFWFGGEFYKEYEVAEGDTVKAPSIPELKEGESFLGWSLDDSNDPDSVIDVSDIEITKDTDFYSVLISNPNDPELMEMLQRGYTQLGKLKVSGNAKTAVTKIRSCIKKVMDDANSGEYIDKKYVETTYKKDVHEVKDIVNNKMNSNERSNFVNLITNPDRIDQDIQDFLVDYFDIDTSI